MYYTEKMKEGASGGRFREVLSEVSNKTLECPAHMYRTLYFASPHQGRGIQGGAHAFGHRSHHPARQHLRLFDHAIGHPTPTHLYLAIDKKIHLELEFGRPLQSAI